MVILMTQRGRELFPIFVSPYDFNIIHRRHLLRLWLRNDELAWKTPEPLKDPWKRLYDNTTPDDEYFPLEPEIRKAAKGNGTGKYV